MGRRWLLGLVCAVVGAAVAAPQLETIDLRVGQQLTLPVAADANYEVSDLNIVRISANTTDFVSLIGHEPGRAVVKIQSPDGSRSLLVRVSPAAARPGQTAEPLRDSPTVAAGGPAAAPVARGATLMARAANGLQVQTLVNKLRAVPDEELIYTVICRNNGPAPEAGVEVAVVLPEGLELVPGPSEPGVTLKPSERSVEAQASALEANRELAFSYRAKVIAREEGRRIATAAAVRSEQTATPRMGPPATVEVASAPLLAVFALPDVVLARTAQRRPLIDVGEAPGQRMVEHLESVGVLQGYPDGTFRPEQPVTRAEATKMIVAVTQLTRVREETGINIALRRPATVDVTLYGPGDQVVRKLAEDWALGQGNHQVVWDGRTDAGRPVAVGTYRYAVDVLDREGVEQTFDGTIAAVAVEVVTTELKSSFADVPADAWFRPYVAQAEQSGIVQGYPGGQFRPHVPIRRVENTVMVVRAAGLTAQAEQRMNEQLGLTDAGDVPRWAVGYVAVATTHGPEAERPLLVAYTDNRFLPNQSLTRMEAASTLERLLERVGPVQVPVSGRIASGHAVTINGVEVAAEQNGRFRQDVTVDASQRVVRITAR